MNFLDMNPDKKLMVEDQTNVYADTYTKLYHGGSTETNKAAKQNYFNKTQQALNGSLKTHPKAKGVTKHLSNVYDVFAPELENRGFTKEGFGLLLTMTHAAETGFGNDMKWDDNGYGQMQIKPSTGVDLLFNSQGSNGFIGEKAAQFLGYKNKKELFNNPMIKKELEAYKNTADKSKFIASDEFKYFLNKDEVQALFAAAKYVTALPKRSK